VRTQEESQKMHGQNCRGGQETAGGESEAKTFGRI